MMTMTKTQGLAAALAAGLLVGSSASAAAQDFSEISGLVRVAAERRDRLVSALRKDLRPGEKGIFHILATPPSDLAETRQNSDFFYLTGLHTPGAGLLIFFDERTMSERLYLRRRDPASERWTGAALSPGGIDPNSLGPNEERRRAMVLTGFGSEDRGAHSMVSEIGALRQDLSYALRDGSILFLSYEPPALDDAPTPESSLVAEIRARYPQARIVSAREALTSLRLVKSREEIEAIRRAVSITCEAQRAAMRTIRPGMKEYEIEAVIEYVFTRSGARSTAFPTMVGSGPNSCVFHYDRNERTIEEGDLVVIDAGAEYGRYAADITRTLPASGRFTDDQIRLYRAVLRAQGEAKALVRPGSRIRDIHDRAAAVLAEEGLKERLLHGCCHFVGLDAHDVGDRDVLLAPGMVLTVEPGVYIPEKEIGVRVEDLFLVTEGGAEQLSACAPSTVEDLLAEMSRKAALPEFSPAGPASPRR